MICDDDCRLNGLNGAAGARIKRVVLYVSPADDVLALGPLAGYGDRRQIKQLVIDAAGGAAVADINAPIASYMGAAIEVVDEDGDNQPLLTFNENGLAFPQNTYNAAGSLVALGNALGATTSLYVVNPSGDVDQENLRGLVREVDGTMIEQVAYGERSGFFEDLIEAVMGIALHHPRCATRLYGIASADVTQETAAAA